jgi:serine/threonine protein kinase
VHEVLGSGTFGQVAAVVRNDNKKGYAMKIIKSKKAYFQFVNTYEIKILQILNKYEDKLAGIFDNTGTIYLTIKLLETYQKPVGEPSARKLKGEDLWGEEGEYDKKIITLKDTFEHATHMILMFEKLDMSLLDLLKIANFQGFTLNVIAKFGEQILNGLKILKRKKIVHCDLKPENILLMKYIFDTNPTQTPLAKRRTDSKSLIWDPPVLKNTSRSNTYNPVTTEAQRSCLA